MCKPLAYAQTKLPTMHDALPTTWRIKSDTWTEMIMCEWKWLLVNENNYALTNTVRCKRKQLPENENNWAYKR